MSKKEIIIYGLLALLASSFLIYNTFIKGKTKTVSKSESLVGTPDYDEDGFYVENSDSRYKKLNLFDKKKAPDVKVNDDGTYYLDGVLYNKDGQKISERPDADKDKSIFGLSAASASAIGSDSLGVWENEKKVKNKIRERYGNAGTLFYINANGDTIALRMEDFDCPPCDEKKAVKKRGNVKLASQGVTSMFSTDTVKKEVKKPVVKKAPKKEEKVEFYVVENQVAIPVDTLDKEEDRQQVLMFFKGEFYGSQTLEIGQSVQIKAKEEIKTQDIYFPSGTIFYGEVRQKGRRFTSELHRALYNYKDYPVEQALSIYDMTFSEGIMIMDYIDELKDENTDEILDNNFEQADEMSQLARSSSVLTQTLLEAGRGTAKSLKKKKLYSLELESGYDMMIGVYVDREWFYSVQNANSEQETGI